MKVVVLGAGVGGLATALLLRRDDHDVTIVERDSVDVGNAVDAPGWKRKGIPHFLQPHLFIPRGRLELMTHLRDVYDDLIAAGASDIDTRPKMPGPSNQEGDELLQYLAVRRPLIEWALRRAVRANARIDVRAGTAVRGLGVTGGRVCRVEIDGATLEADLVVDAMGRRTPTAGWLGSAGVTPDGREANDCSAIYYSRYYQTRPEFELPDAPSALGPRGDLGYLGYATFPGDNGTFAALISVPTGCPEWRALRDPAVFGAAVAAIPPLAGWADPDGTEPLTDVLTMAGMENVIRRYGPSSTPGLVPVGDAYSHTDPTIAHGLSFALVHAVELRDALRNGSDVDDATATYAMATAPALQERFELASGFGRQRLARWTGGTGPPTRADSYELFSLAAAGTVAMFDADVFRVFNRRMGLLDSTTVLDDDTVLLDRIEQRFSEMVATMPRPAGPSRDEMVELTAAV